MLLSSAMKKQSSKELLTCPSLPSGDPSIWCFQRRLQDFSQPDGILVMRLNRAARLPKGGGGQSKNNKMGSFERAFGAVVSRLVCGWTFF